MATWAVDMFCNFYFVKKHEIVDNSTTTGAREKMHRIEIIEF
jgi:hypothetical protein